jgi:hypothetical protein
VGARDLLRPLGLERRDARPQRLELGPLFVLDLVGRGHRLQVFATRGASRWKTKQPRAKTNAMMPSGIGNRSAPPIASAAPAACGSIMTWRISVRIKAIGLQR